MGRPRYIWWSYAKGMIRRYPELEQKHNWLQTQKLTPSYSGIRSAGGTGRPVERLAIKTMGKNEQREFEAVRAAIRATERLRDGEERMKMIRLVYWGRIRYTLNGAALKCNISIATANRWHRDFVYSVARNFGLLD